MKSKYITIRKTTILWTIVAAIITVIIFSIIYSPPKSNDLSRSKKRVLSQVFNYIDSKYFETVDREKLLEGAIHGIFSELDPHSVYIPDDELEAINEQIEGEFQGIGIEFDILDGYITVIAPVADSPSERAGLLPGDQITKIDSKDAYGITRDGVFKNLRGKRGSSVVVTINRPGTPDLFDVTLIRDDIPLYSIRASVMLDDQTGYIWLTRFSATTVNEVKSALKKLIDSGMKRLIFDLRNNSGGYLSQAAEIADLFIARSDTLVYTRGKNGRLKQVFLSKSNGPSNYPLIVMVNRGSASASEIVAGAIQDLDRGLVIGETTFGKGLVQHQIPLRDGSAIRLTVARYYTPSGRLIQRPYENGADSEYYSDLYRENREVITDSLENLRPKYFTRNGRIVYGGGGITPDIYIPLEIEMDIRLITIHPKRPLFAWASRFIQNNQEQLTSLEDFENNWHFSERDFQGFLNILDTDSIEYDSSILIAKRKYLENQLKEQIIANRWGRDESFRVRLLNDNQVISAISYFIKAKELAN